MTPVQLAYTLLFMICLALIGFTVIVDWLLRKIKSLKKPKVLLQVDQKKIKKILDVIPDLTLEERLFIIELLVGAGMVYLSLDSGKVTIKGIGRYPQDDEREPMDYAG